MTHNDGFIQQLEAYLDDYEGLTPLPETVRSAVRAALPRTKQAGSLSGPARYVTMTLNKMTPVVLATAAAILVLAVAGVLILGRPNVGDPDPSASPSASASASALAATPSAQACGTTTATAAQGRIDVQWCSVRANGELVAVPFSMDGPAGWLDEWFGDSLSLWLIPSDGGRIALYVEEDLSVEEMVDEIGARSEYVVENQAPVTLGGLEGFVLDVSLAEGTTSADAPPLIDSPSVDWLVQPDPARAWIVELDGAPLMIVTNADRADELAAALETIEWGN